MRIQTTSLGTKNEIKGYTLWLSKNDTEKWATRSGNSWPCSTARGKAIVVEVDSNGLCNCTKITMKVDSYELDAIVSDHLPKEYRHLWPVWE